MLHIGSDNSIALTRGDTAYIQVPITTVHGDGTSEPYVMDAADTLTMSLKKTIKDTEVKLTMTVVGTNTFHIKPADTQSCDFCKYIYDVQLHTKDGNVYTVIEPSTFEVLKEVTC